MFKQSVIKPLWNLVSMIKFCFYAFLYKKKREQKGCVMVFLRDNKTDSDTFPLLEYLNNLPKVKTLYFVSANKALTNQYLELLQPFINLEVVVINKKDLPRYLALCYLAFTKNKGDLSLFLSLRKLAKLTIVRIFHGPVTKNIGLLRNDKKYKDGIVNYADIYITQSSTEKYYRCTTALLNPTHVWPLGYPRFFRAKQFLNNQSKPIITSEGEELIKSRSGYKKILYAPTHRKEKGLEDKYFTVDFNKMLEQENAVLIIRPHATDRRSLSESFKHINSDNILTLPSSCVPGSIELMPFIDCLITDYSSIFLEGIACKVPTIFIYDENDFLFKSMGLAYEKEIALPGPQASSSSDLISATLAAINNNSAEGNLVGYKVFGLIENNIIEEAYKNIV